MTIKAHFDGKALVLDEPVDLPINQPLTVTIDPEALPARKGTFADLLNSDLAGIWKDRTDMGDTLEFARKLRKDAETRHHVIHDPS